MDRAGYSLQAGLRVDLARRVRLVDVGDNDLAALFVTTASGELFPVRAIPRLQAHRRATYRVRGGAGQVDGRQD
jgi:hypothetical protein